jgi:ABC-2 type transport system ATP-binding protein
MTNEAVILTQALTKSYGNAQAVRSLNLSVGRNRITAFLGRNGAGKSTTIKMLLGMIRPTAGSGIVLGKQIANVAENRELRQRVAYVAEDKPLYGYMTVEQTMHFASSFYPDWRKNVEKKLIRDYELPLRRRVKMLSKGMRTKLALLLAFARRPELLILDEPSEGLDPVGIEHLLQLLVAQAAEGVSVFFSSHQITEVERVADQVCILEKGCLLVDASLDQLRQFYRRIDLVFSSPPPEREFRISGVQRIRTSGHRISVFASRNADAVIERAHDLNVVSVEVAPVGLRDVFLETVKENGTCSGTKPGSRLDLDS